MPSSTSGSPNEVGWVIRKVTSPSDIRKGDVCFITTEVIETSDVDLWRRVCAEAYTKQVPIVR
jgi:hypothetical protein